MLAVRAPAHVLVLADAVGGKFFGIAPVEFDVAQLGVWQQHPVREDGDADARTQRDHDDDAVVAAARAEAHLGESGGIRVVD